MPTPPRRTARETSYMAGAAAFLRPPHPFGTGSGSTASGAAASVPASDPIRKRSAFPVVRWKTNPSPRRAAAALKRFRRGSRLPPTRPHPRHGRHRQPGSRADRYAGQCQLSFPAKERWVRVAAVTDAAWYDDLAHPQAAEVAVGGHEKDTLECSLSLTTSRHTAI
jgi:hypothetical protein